MTRILITGSDGFVGTVLSGELSRLGHDVSGTVFDRASEDGNEYPVDITRPETFSVLPSGEFDVIIHNAGMMDQMVPRKQMFQVNAEGTQNVLDWARTNGCRHLIQISSSSVYGLKTMGQNRIEDTGGLLSRLGTPYQRSKSKGERLIRRSGVPFTILRLPPLLGYGDSFVSPTIVHHLIDGSFFRVGRRNLLVSVLAIGNLSGMVEQVIRRGPTNTEYNCVSHHVQWLDLVREYAAALDVEVPETRKPLLSILTNTGDVDHQFMLAFSRFGSHMPSDKFVDEFGDESIQSWQDAVRDAVLGVQTGGQEWL